MNWLNFRKQDRDTGLDLQQLLDSLSDGVLSLTQDGRLDYVNRAWQELSGYSTDQSHGRMFGNFLHPEDNTRWQRALQQVNEQTLERQRSSEPQLLWLRLLHPRQELRWCELRLQAIPDSEHLSATLCDITHQVQNDQQRDATHRSLNAMLERLPIMIYRSRNDRDWTMEFVSEGCRELTGYSPTELVKLSQRSYGKLIHPADADRVWQQVQEALLQRRSFELDYRLFHIDGSMRYVTEKGCGVYTSNGSILAVEGVIFARQHSQTGDTAADDRPGNRRDDRQVVPVCDPGTGN
jgi:PAS domain S-box-containing protein